MEYYRVIKIGLGLDTHVDGKLVEQHIPIAAFDTEECALKYAEEFVENYRPAPKPMLDTKTVYIDRINIDVPSVGLNRQEMMEALGMGEPLK